MTGAGFATSMIRGCAGARLRDKLPGQVFWGSETLIKPNAKYPSVPKPQIAVNSKGDAVVAWSAGTSAYNITQSKIFYKIRTASGAWSKTKLAVTKDNLVLTSVVMGENGDALLVWHYGYNPTLCLPRYCYYADYGLQVSRLTKNTSVWRHSRELAHSANYYIVDSTAALDSLGRAMLFYQPNDHLSKQKGLYALTQLPGQGWSMPKRLRTDQHYYSVAGNNTGNVTLYIRTYDPVNLNNYSLLALNGNVFTHVWDKPVILTGPDQVMHSSRIGFGRNGEAVVAWEIIDPVDQSRLIRAVTRPSWANVWGQPTTVAVMPKTDSGWGWLVSAAISPNGKAVATYTTNDTLGGVYSYAFTYQ